MRPDLGVGIDVIFIINIIIIITIITWVLGSMLAGIWVNLVSRQTTASLPLRHMQEQYLGHCRPESPSPGPRLSVRRTVSPAAPAVNTNHYHYQYHENSQSYSQYKSL